MKNELKKDRIATAYDCYTKLSRDIAPTSKESQKWDEWEANNDKRIVENSTFKTRRTFIGLVLEDKQEYEKMRNEGHQHVIFTQRDVIPDMLPLENTLKLYQVVPTMTGKTPKFITSFLPCSCPPCRDNPLNWETCEYKKDRNIKIQELKEKRVSNDNGSKHEIIEDQYGFHLLQTNELKIRCKCLGLPASGTKNELIETLVDYEQAAQEYILMKNNNEEVCHQ